MHATTLIDRVLIRLAEVSTVSPKHWSRAEVLGWLNEGVKEMSLLTTHLTKTITVSWAQDNNVLSLPVDTVMPIEVYFSNKIVKKYKISDLDSKIKWDDGSTGLHPKAWCPLGTQKIVVYPLSSRTSQSLSIVVMYSPANIAESGEDVLVPDQYIDAIEHFMLARSKFKEGGAEFKQADEEYNRFLDEVEHLKEKIAERGNEI